MLYGSCSRAIKKIQSYYETMTQKSLSFILLPRFLSPIPDQWKSGARLISTNLCAILFIVWTCGRNGAGGT